MEIGPIIKGHVNELLDKNKDISEVRMEICRKCPLYRDILGGQCNPNLWLNPETNEISNRRTVNYIKGCVFIYKDEYDPNKNYSYIKPKKIVSDETKKKMISSNAKSIPIYKYNLDKVLIEEYPSRLNCEKNERFKNI